MNADRHDALAGIVEGILGSVASFVLSGVAGSGKTAILDAVAAQLALGPAKVLRTSAVAGADSRALRGFIAEMAGLQSAEAMSDEDLVRAFEMLTVPDNGRGARIVLLADGAETLPPAALRYVQLACKAQPALQVVFAARPGFAGRLEGTEFAFLRSRIAREFLLPAPNPLVPTLLASAGAAADAVAAVATPAGIGAAASPTKQRRLRPPAWAMVWTGLIAEVVLGTALLASTTSVRQDQPLAGQGTQVAAARQGGAAASTAAGAPEIVPLPSGEMAGTPEVVAPLGRERQVVAAAPPGPQPAAVADPLGAARAAPTVEAKAMPGAAEASSEPGVPASSTAGSEPARVAVPVTAAAPAPNPGDSAEEAAPVRPRAPVAHAHAARPAPPPPASGQVASNPSTVAAPADGRGAPRRPLREGGGTHLVSSGENRWYGWTDQEREAPRRQAAPDASTDRPSSGYIGVYVTGADGVRVFKTLP